MSKLIFVLLFILSCSPALGQTFTDDPNAALDSGMTLAEEIIEDPLKLEGLKSVVFRYNRARMEISPAGYERPEWFDGQLIPVLMNIDTGMASPGEISPLPDEEKAKILDAFSKNSESYYNSYKNLSGVAGLSEISADQMLAYLSAYAYISYSVDASFWGTLSSITGVWPLCFWDG